jgi:hypothetical protein
MEIKFSNKEKEYLTSLGLSESEIKKFENGADLLNDKEIYEFIDYISSFKNKEI